MRQGARRSSHTGLCSPDNRLCRVGSRPWNKMVTWNRTPPGLKTAAPCRPRAALAVEGSERRWNLPEGRFRRCTGRLNATQPGVLTVSPLYIRGLTLACKGRVAARQHFALFALFTGTVLNWD